MADEIIEYRSAPCDVTNSNGAIETKTNKGITCIWNSQIIDNNRKFTWIFNWDESKKEGVEEISGYIVLKRQELADTYDIRFDVNLTDTKHSVQKVVKLLSGFAEHTALFSYRLILHRQLEIDDNSPYDAMFLPSEMTDAILVVDGKKLHVNKAFLSFHSDFFRALFTSNFKKGTMDEIPIQDVSYEDFGCLLSIVYPKNSFPTGKLTSFLQIIIFGFPDKTVEKLLELADRFILPCVIRTVEHHLLINSKFDNEKLMWLADKYNMPTLLKKTIRLVNSADRAKNVEKSPDYKGLSDKTKADLFDQLVKLV